MTSRLAVVAVASTLVLAACGGGGSDEAAPDDTSQPELQTDTAAPVPEAIVETTVAQPVATEAQDTQVDTTEPAPTPTPAVDAVFCGAAEEFFVPARSLDFGDINDPVVLGGVIGLLDGRAQPVIDAAPTEADAALFVESKGLLDLASPALASIGFDLERSGELQNNIEVGEALVDFGALLGDMQTFLVDRCDSSTAELDQRAMDIIDGFASSTTQTTEVVAPDTVAPPPDTAAPGTVAPDPAEAVIDYTPIENDTGELRLDVPSTWTDVTGAPEGVLQQVAAAPNLQAFLDSYTQPGVLLITGDATTPEAWRDGLSATVGIALEDGCVINDTAEYDDGVYTGEENLLSCGDPAAVAHLIGGRNETGSLFFLLAIVRPTSDPAVRDRIVQSFFID